MKTTLETKVKELKYDFNNELTYGVFNHTDFYVYLNNELRRINKTYFKYYDENGVLNTVFEDVVYECVDLLSKIKTDSKIKTEGEYYVAEFQTIDDLLDCYNSGNWKIFEQ